MPLNNLKKIARYKVRRQDVTHEEFEDYLKIWWSEKYNLPPNHPLLLQLTIEELIIEYYRDIFAKDPKELEAFEAEIGIVDPKSDEAWFKKHMGDEYTTESAVSEKFKKGLKNGENKENDKKDNEFDDVFTLGG